MLSRIAISGAAVLALAICAFTAGDAVAGKGGGGASLTTTIALSGEAQAAVASASDGAVSGDATFFVTRSIPYDKETIWVTNQCFDAAGNMVADTDAAVLWGTSVSLSGTTSPMATGGVTCTAYVTLRPWQNRPLGDSITFAVGQ